MSPEIKPSRAEAANMALTLISAVMFAVFFCAMPRYVDDFWFSQIIYGRRQTGLPVTLHEIYETWAAHYLHDNARLANIIFVPFLLLPKWCGSIIASLLWTYVLLRAPHISGISLRSSPLIPLFLTLCAFALPWYDSIGAENYQFNYVIATAISVAAIGMFLSAPRYGHAGVLLCFILGCVAGAWHEGFGIPVAAGMASLYALRRKYRTVPTTAMLAGMAAGIIWIIAAPAFWHRLNKIGETGESLTGHTIFISALHPLFFLMLALLAIILLNRQRRAAFLNGATLILLVSAVCSFVIHMFSTRPPRTGWWCEFASILLIIREFPVLLRHPWLRYTPRSVAAAALLSALTIAHLAVVDYYSVLIRHHFNRALEQHMRNPAQTIFADVVTEHDSPLLACLMPDFTLFVAQTNLKFINECIHADDDLLFVPIPRELSEVDSLSGRPLGGNLNCRIYKGRIFMPTDSTGYGEFPAEVDFGFARRNNVRMCYYTFVSPRDGRRYAYLYPWRRVIEMRLGDITAVSRQDPLCP